MKILLIEDEPRIASFVRRGLVAEGFDVTVATDGREGLAAALEIESGLVLLDLVLPELRGEDVLRRVRAERPQLPVIVLTSKDAISDRVSSLEAGADDYMLKPFSFVELVARIHARLRAPRHDVPAAMSQPPCRGCADAGAPQRRSASDGPPRSTAGMCRHRGR